MGEEEQHEWMHKRDVAHKFEIVNRRLDSLEHALTTHPNWETRMQSYVNDRVEHKHRNVMQYLELKLGPIEENTKENGESIKAVVGKQDKIIWALLVGVVGLLASIVMQALNLGHHA